MRWIMGAIFATMLTAVVTAGHYYLWRRYLYDTRLKTPWRRGLTIALIGLGLLLPAVFILSRVALDVGMCFLILAGFFWMGVLFYAVLILGLWDGGRAIWRLKSLLLKNRVGKGEGDEKNDDIESAVSGESNCAPKEKRKEAVPSVISPAKENGIELKNPDRRLFMARTAATTSLVGAGAIGMIGLRSARVHVETPEIPIKLERFPKQMSGFRVAVLSDLHIGPTLRESFTQRVVKITNGLKPDMTVVLGDIVDGPVSLLGNDVKPLGGLKAPHGVFYVTGNHEYYSGAVEWVEFMKRIGMRVLMNERVRIGEKNAKGAGFDLAGVGDRRAGMFVKSHAQDISKAVKGRDESRELVVLAHQPSQIPHVEKARPGLQISGHTHGGQIWPWTYAVRLAEPYLCGLYKHNARTQIFVTRGVGYWGPPIRFLAPAEIPCLVLSSS